MANGRLLRAGGAALALCGTLLAGCTTSGSAASGPSARDGSPSASPGTGTGTGTGPAGTGTANTGAGPRSRRDVEADPAKLPRTPARARELIGAVLIGPEEFGPGVVRGAPYERGTGWWPVLGDDCVWQRGELPEDVLASRTRMYELPAADGKGTVRLTATVTVYRDPGTADWSHAATLEETLRCPEQRLGPHERLTGLFSQAHYFGEGQNTYAEDALLETGGFADERPGGPYPYLWWQARVGPVLVSTAVKGAEGRPEDESTDLLTGPMVTMVARVLARVGWEERK
ncbi:hypothetical protein [Streptomyces sp. TRM49041]|uniref:hypothetical protein n=1 Tax=Streptomyces sp. TRM49041 TaxID=2603216 RepID=UPI0016568DF6|nr:hypothetical protein [Streptomyces sp. TRM49041]